MALASIPVDRLLRRGGVKDERGVGRTPCRYSRISIKAPCCPVQFASIMSPLSLIFTQLDVMNLALCQVFCVSYLAVSLLRILFRALLDMTIPGSGAAAAGWAEGK